MKKIEGSPKSLKQLLQNTKYSIHYYQREYMWQRKHIEELIDDLTTEFLIYYKSGDDRIAVQDYGAYFMGSIVLAGRENAIIDGQNGKIFIQPDNNTLALYTARKNRQTREHLNLKRQSGLPSETKNGQFIKLSANLSDINSLSDAENNDANGIGLFKTDFIFTNRKSPPSENEQFEVYKSVIKHFPNSTATFCMANLSCGKGIEYLDLPDETNFYMGYKGIRVEIGFIVFFSPP